MDDYERWSALGSAVVADSADRFGVLASPIRLLSGDGLAGPAFTVRTMAAENSTLHRAVQAAPAGSLLVVDAAGYEDRAVWGELITVAARARRIRGVVIDGAVRDIEAIRRMNFPVFARSITPAGPHRGWRGTFGEPISCGGTVVSTGDLVVGDADGVVVVPAANAERVLQRAEQLVESERDLLRRAAEGIPTTELLNIE